VIWVGGGKALEELDFIEGRLGVPGGRFHDLEGDVMVKLFVVRQPDCAEMAPTEFPDNCIAAIAERIADVDWVVSALDVVFPVFLVLCHDTTSAGTLLRGRRIVRELGGRRLA
jgi:hypothetical protein